LEIIHILEKIAPVKAIRGNIDKDKWADQFLETMDLDILGRKIYVIHNVKDLNFNPEEKGYIIIISGHSHKPLINNKGNILYFNPGSAGKKRFSLPITVGQIKIDKENISAKIIEIQT